LAYWLEYMDRRGRSRLVQFWLTIEGFKDPLEAAGQDSALDATVLPMDTDLSINADQTIGGDVASLYEAYFARSEAPIEVPPKHVATIKEFVETGTGVTGAEDARRIKHAVFSSQKAVYEQMEEDDWPDFWKSELFLKTITDLSRSAPVTPAPQSLGASPALLSPPSHRLRQLTAPHGPLRQSSDFRSPTFRPLPSTRNGSFAPATAVPFASISTTPPVSERTLTEPKLGSRKTCAGDVDMSASTDSLPTTPPQMPRRSSHLDFLVSGDAPAESKERGALFDDTDEPVVEEEDDDFVQIQRMEAIQAALNDIIASDAASSRSREVPLSPEAESTRSPSASMVLVPPRQKGEEHTTKLLSRSVGDRGKTNGRSSFSAPQSQTPSAKASGPGPSLLHRARLSQLSLSEERPGKLFDDETIAEDEVGSDRDDFTIGDVVQLAAPGNLGLAVEIASCQDKITDLVKQEHLLDTLIRQAELTGNQTELRILRRSQTTVRRELQTAIFQKAQFEQQEEENRLVPGRTSVSIPSSVINADENDGGKHVVRYTVEVQQFGEDGKAVLGWVVARRYNEFWELDRDIRERASADLRSHLLEDLRKVAELPPKKLVPNLSSSFIESRRIGLQRYLQVRSISPKIGSADLYSHSPHRQYFVIRPFSDLSCLAPRCLSGIQGSTR